MSYKKLLALVSLLLMQACTRMPDDIILYCENSFAVYMGSQGKWQTIYAIEQGGPKIITSLAYDPKNRIIAISVESKILTKGSARIILIDPNTKKIFKEISTNIDQIKKMAFDSSGEKIALLVHQYEAGADRKLCILSLDKETLKTLLDGDLLSVSWGRDNDIFLSYKEKDKWFVGSVRVGNGKVEITKIAKGYSINASDSRNSYVYIDTNGNVIYHEMQTQASRTLPLPAKFRDVRALSSVAFMHGSDSIVLAKYGVQWDNLYLFNPPYTSGQKILDKYNFLDYAAVAKTSLH